MRKKLLVAAATAGVVGFSVSALTQTHMHAAFGPVHEMKMKDHMMHMQVVKNKAGEIFVVIPKAEAEMMLGNITFDPFDMSSVGGN